MGLAGKEVGLALRLKMEAVKIQIGADFGCPESCRGSLAVSAKKQDS
jgi:hypothetical protein